MGLLAIAKRRRHALAGTGQVPVVNRYLVGGKFWCPCDSSWYIKTMHWFVPYLGSYTSLLASKTTLKNFTFGDTKGRVQKAMEMEIFSDICH